MPSDIEVEAARLNAEKTKAHIAEIDAELDRLDAYTRRVKQKRLALVQSLHHDLAIISPLNRFPPELLSEIFIHCLPSRGPSLPLHLHAPALLTHICSYWRSVAVTMPRLWDTIELNFHVDVMPLASVETWLSRSLQCPLRIGLRGPLSGSDTERYIETITACSERWRTLQWEPHESEMSMLNSVRGRLHSLEELDLNIEFESGESQMSPEAALIFENSPLLRKVAINHPFLDESLNLPWSQLTYIEVEDCMISDFIFVLESMPNVLHCCMYNLSQVEVPADTTTAVPRTHGRLQTLDLEVDDTDIFSIFDGCTLPNLRNLSIRSKDAPPSSFLAFLRRSQCRIETFTAKQTWHAWGGSACASLVEVLGEMPSVTELTFEGVSSANVDSLLPLLTWNSHPPQRPDLLPSLATFDFLSVHHLNYRTSENLLIEFLRSRQTISKSSSLSSSRLDETTPDGARRLKNATLRFDYPPSDDALRCFHELLRDGLHVTVIRHPEKIVLP